jgi:hypothetical protein
MKTMCHPLGPYFDGFKWLGLSLESVNDEWTMDQFEDTARPLFARWAFFL